MTHYDAVNSRISEVTRKILALRETSANALVNKPEGLEKENVRRNFKAALNLLTDELFHLKLSLH